MVVGCLLLGLFLLVPLPLAPPGGTRIVLDHTQQVYIAPPCFEQAGATNYLTETTWAEAQQKGYDAESACTAELMQPVATPGWQRLWQLSGAGATAWDW